MLKVFSHLEHLRDLFLSKILRVVKSRQTTSERTTDGNTAMLTNGLEILNYKGNDRIYYGPLERIDVVSGGDEYDVMHPPSITINDPLVSAANTCKVISARDTLKISLLTQYRLILTRLLV